MTKETKRLADGRIDLSYPRWDQSTFLGRVRHFASITDVRNVFKSNKQLYDAKELLELYRLKKEPIGTKDEDVWRAKKLYDSAFHPDSGELQNVMGRMSFQVPGGMILTAGMLQFYRSNTAVMFWQWLNQSFNALVNYTNRNAASTITTKQMGVAYVSATTCALLTAITFKKYAALRAPPIIQRFIPFLAVAAANMVNIPLSRQSELTNGVILSDINKNQVSESKLAAIKGISLVVLSRITMAAPGMLIMPLIMDKLERRPRFMKYQRYHIIFQTAMIGCFLMVMVPVACGMFPQNSSIFMNTLKKYEPKAFNKASANLESTKEGVPQQLFFNKGL